jgi:hypothetical protein
LFKLNDPYYNEYTNKDFAKVDEMNKKKQRETEIYIQYLERISLLCTSLHKSFMKRLKTANNEVSKYLADFIVYQYSAISKEVQSREFKRSFEQLSRS